MHKFLFFSKIKSTFTQINPKAFLGTNTNLNHKTHLTRGIIGYFIKNSKKTKKQKDPYDALMIDSYSGLFLVLGKCSIPFLSGNWNLILPSFISITTPVVRKNGLPRNNWTRRIAINIKNNKIYGHIIPICKNKNIINSSQRLFVTPPIQSYTNHTRKCVRSRWGTHGKISQHNFRHK